MTQPKSLLVLVVIVLCVDTSTVKADEITSTYTNSVLKIDIPHEHLVVVGGATELAAIIVRYLPVPHMRIATAIAHAIIGRIAAEDVAGGNIGVSIIVALPQEFSFRALWDLVPQVLSRGEKADKRFNELAMGS